LLLAVAPCHCPIMGFLVVLVLVLVLVLALVGVDPCRARPWHILILLDLCHILGESLLLMLVMMHYLF